MKLRNVLKVTQSDNYIEIVNSHYETIKWGLNKDLELTDDLLNCKVKSIASLTEDVSDYNGISILIDFKE